MNEAERAALVKEVSASKRSSNRRTLWVVVLAVTIVILGQGASTYFQYRLWQSDNAQAEVIAEQASDIKKQAHDNYCNDLEDRINSRGADRLIIGLIKNIIVASTADEPRSPLGRFIRNVDLPQRARPRLIKSYHRECEGGEFYEPSLGALDRMADKKKKLKPKKQGSSTSSSSTSSTSSTTTRTPSQKKDTATIERPGKSDPKGNAKGHRKPKKNK